MIIIITKHANSFLQNTIQYWLGSGVDGFRFDAVNYLFEREDLKDEPKSNKPGVYDTDYDALDHIYTLNQPETYEMVKTWRKLIDESSSTDNTTK